MNPLLADWTAPFELPPFASIGEAHFLPAFDVGARRGAGEHRQDRGRSGGPELRQHDRGDGAGRAEARPGGGGVLQPRRGPHQRCDRGAAARAEPAAGGAPCRDDDERGAVRARRRAGGAQGRARAELRAGSRARALSPDVRPGRRAAGGFGPGAAQGDHAAAGEPRHRLRAERAGRREGLDTGARAGRPRGPAGRPRRRGGGGGRGAGPRRARGHAVAQPDRAVPAVLAAARPARAGVPRLGGARRERRRDRQPGDRRRDAQLARGAGAAARLSGLRRVQARDGDGEDAGKRCAIC